MQRVIWQYGSEVMGSLESAAPSLEMAQSRAGAVVESVPLVAGPAPVFAGSPARLRERSRALAQAVPEIGDLGGFFHAFVPDRLEAERLAERLAGEPGVAVVEIEERPNNLLRGPAPAVAALPADAGAPTPDLSPRQGYLDAAPAGIDARFAWTVPGGAGDGIVVVDVEWGCNRGHEDLLQRLFLVHGPDVDDDHGTAVLGVVGGDDNGVGVVGVAHRAGTGVASALLPGGGWNPEAAVEQVASKINPGNVILLELQGPGGVSLERRDLVFAAVLAATSPPHNLYVVAAAGNGELDLDAPAFGGQFDRAARDSGAIFVGAGGSSDGAQPRARRRSNFGSRLDVQGWGERVVTCGGLSSGFHDFVLHPSAARCYTQSFRDTSSAAAIVAGAVACIAGAVKASGRPPLSPREMRDLLVATGTPQEGDVTQQIGPLPDLRAALGALGLGP